MASNVLLRAQQGSDAFGTAPATLDPDFIILDGGVLGNYESVASTIGETCGITLTERGATVLLLR